MIGRTLLQYTITEQIGEGGMGVVYKARDRRLKRVVVLKTLRPERLGDPEKKKRFVQEARAASALNHPNIVTIHDIASVDGAEFIVMEYVQGKSLDCLIPECGLDTETALKYAIQITSALEAAHENGIVHRDLKPGNIMVTGSGLVKLLDFGLAKLLELPRPDFEGTNSFQEPAPTTVEGSLVGTIAYMSPEQALAENLDGRSDLFSFGALFYEMVTGRRAFRGGSPIATLCAVLREDPPRPSTLNSRLPTGLDDVIMRCLQKRPADRFGSAAELKVDLESVLSHGESPKTDAFTMAILPFANMSGDSRLDSLCEGLPKDIAGALMRVPDLRVTVPAAAGIPVQRPLNMQALGRKLRADVLLDGSLRSGGNRIRITAELVNIANGCYVWSERYDREAPDAFAVQDAICRDIVARVSRYLTISRSPVSDADRSYAEGRAQLDRFTCESLSKAKESLERAVALQKDSAAVYAAVAEYYISAALLGIRAAGEAMPKADWAARKALSIDANSELAHASLGVISGLYEHSWEEAGDSFRRALAINAGSASVRQAHSLWHLVPLGRIPEAIDDMAMALQAEPTSIRRMAGLAYLRYLNREFDEAVRLCRAALQADTRFWLAHWVLSWALLAPWQKEAALEHARAALAEEGASGWTRALHAVASSVAGDAEPARAALRDMDCDENRRDCAWAALIYLGTGDVDKAFRSAGRAIEEHNAMGPAVIRHALFDPYRSDPRYTAITSRMRMGIARTA
jgi:eukaryotic-like serine/threonine-protein kinase